VVAKIGEGMADTRYQEGSLKKFKTKQGVVWKLRYFATRCSDGKWSEQTPLYVGAVSDLSTENKARVKAVELGLIEQINRTSIPVNKITFGFLARDYVRINLHDEVHGASHYQQAPAPSLGGNARSRNEGSGN
jgi:hypothetical protein